MLRALAGLEVLYDGPDVLDAAVVDYVAQAVAALEAWAYQLVNRAAALPRHPFKFLYPLNIEDAGIFFRHDAATEALIQTIVKDRLTVLHGRSGIGKTSLLNAGLAPRLIDGGRLPVYARACDDAVSSIKCAVAPPWPDPWPELLIQLSLHEFLGLVCAHLRGKTRELVVILDGFEEFLAFWPTREQRRPYADALADCCEDGSLPLGFVIARATNITPIWPNSRTVSRPLFPIRTAWGR